MGIVIIQDTREQAPLDFRGIEGVDQVDVSGLAYGDYAGLVNGKLAPIIIERKSIGDLFGTMGAGYVRFKREMERAKKDNMTLILAVEGSYTDVWNGYERSQIEGPSMIKKLDTLYVKYDLFTWYCESRRVMARRIVGLFSAIDRAYEE